MTVITEALFTAKQLAALDATRIPHHIAIIPDGNRRWAKLQRRQYTLGHRAGAHKLIETVKAAKEIGVGAVTFYVFSTENWNRSQAEITALMWLLKDFLKKYSPEMKSEGVRLKTIGDLSAFSEDVLDAINEAVQYTANGDQIDMILALNYGARDEIRRTVERIVEMCAEGKLKPAQITEAVISKHLDTAPWGDPDLLIRTSGEKRISNFLLWQLSYTEIYVSDVLWPDFTPDHLLEAIADFQKRERRLGGG